MSPLKYRQVKFILLPVNLVNSRRPTFEP